MRGDFLGRCSSVPVVGDGRSAVVGDRFGLLSSRLLERASSGTLGLALVSKSDSARRRLAGRASGVYSGEVMTPESSFDWNGRIGPVSTGGGRRSASGGTSSLRSSGGGRLESLVTLCPRRRLGLGPRGLGLDGLDGRFKGLDGGVLLNWRMVGEVAEDDENER